jgi:hypothetical protein
LVNRYGRFYRLSHRKWERSSNSVMAQRTIEVCGNLERPYKTTCLAVSVQHNEIHQRQGPLSETA